MNRKITGVLSLLTFILAVFYSVIIIWNETLIGGIFYLLGSFISMNLILFFYCCKCKCKDENCGHILPGKITKFFPERKIEPYNFLDYIMSLISILFMVAVPLLFFGSELNRYLIFYGLLLFTVLLINRFVCVGCDNESCFLAK